MTEETSDTAANLQSSPFTSGTAAAQLRQNCGDKHNEADAQRNWFVLAHTVQDAVCTAIRVHAAAVIEQNDQDTDQR